MTISEAYDRLLAAPVSRIDWKDGSGPLRALQRPFIVRDASTDEHADAWIGVAEDGLSLHFNARANPGDIQQSGQTEPLVNIARIA